MASVPASTFYPGLVFMVADRPGIKAGGTDGFAAPPWWPQWYNGASPFTGNNMRKARRHGGAIPWSMIKEIQNPRDTVVPAPTDADAHYVSEIVGHLSVFPPFGSNWFDYMYGGNDLDIVGPTMPGDPYTFTPNTRMAFYLNASWPNIMPALTRPEAPVLSADDPYLDPTLPLTDTHLFHGPAGAAAVGLMNRMHLIKPASTDLNTTCTGSQVQYFVEIPGAGEGINNDYPPWIGLTAWDGANWTADLRAGSTYWAFGLCVGGWTYAAEMDPATGKVSATYPMPEGRTREGYMFAPYLSNSTSWAPMFWAISWPTGVRAFYGTWYNPYADVPGNGPPKVMWKLARPWCFRCRAQMAMDPWNGSSTPPGFMPDTSYPSPSLWRGYEPGDELAARAGSSGWNELCSFPAADPTGTGDLGAPTWNTLPPVGAEVMLVFVHPDDLAGAMFGDVRPYLRLVPEATVSPINIPAMHGGVIPGGSP